MKLFLDVTRVATRMIGSAPTGIDRVEYAYATEIICKSSGVDFVGVITTPLFTGALRKPLIQEVLGRVALAWMIGSSPGKMLSISSSKSISRRRCNWIDAKLSDRRCPAPSTHARSSHFPGPVACTRLDATETLDRARGWPAEHLSQQFPHSARKSGTLRVDSGRINRMRFLHSRSHPNRISGIRVPAVSGPA